jgi:MurNAc alpha-1-phosphate uridylyltransferase
MTAPRTTPKRAPRTAMVLAAGLGTRMRPLTDHQPKALVPVAGKALIDHTLDRLAEAGVETAVVNVHHFADQMRAHLASRTSPRIVISDEIAGLLDSAGGIALAAPLLGDDPIFVANIDNVWIERGTPALASLAAIWDPARMDICILLAARADTYGYDRPEGFLRDEEGRLTHSNSADPLPPFNNIGFQILKPSILASRTGAFSILPIWKQLSAEGRLYGAVTTADIIHVSDPAGRDYADSRLT